MKEISLFWPYMSFDIKLQVMDTLNSRWLGQGPKVELFEQALREKFTLPYPLMTNSGTSALELAYHLLDLKAGDEVISPVLTCTATNLPLLRRGVKIVWADIDPDTLCIDANDALNKVTRKTKAIIGVNLGGIECELGKTKGEIPVIIDAAQSIGTMNGDYSIYSFQAIKHFTTGDGGMLATPTKETYERAKKLRWFGIDRDKKRAYDWQAYKEREMTFNIEEAGYKYQPTDIAAAMGLAGLKAYDDILTHQQMIFDLYKNELDELQGIKVIDGKTNTYWLATLLVPNRDRFAAKLKEAGIETNLVQLRNDIFHIFGGKRTQLPHMNEVEDHYISIPLHTNVSVKDAAYIISTIRKGW